MKILIMCGGRGKRLGVLSESTPKPLMKLMDKTILEMKFHNYIQQGFDNFILCIGYKGDLIKKAVTDFDLPVKCEYSDAGEPAGILKRLYNAKESIDKSIVLTYGDTYTDISLKDLVLKHEKSDNEVTIVVAPIQNPFGLVEFDKNDKVTYFKEKPILNYYIGYAIINKSALDLVPEKVIEMDDGKGLVTFYKILLAMEKLGVYYYSGLQITFNTENELKVAQEKFVDFYTMREVNEK